ncbi:MAG TPA: two-component regulator propeller domain-containing protein [Chitinophaga sp.]|uniref:two-component regulator propeller domain-containing protein n=1 Tax=Chitinophaga sp. TaxID=1869181 RepID=UPI002C43384E|nr:two-component regulator propeller domain-containing protein [Chitinophaga sp.]HVI44254.1 two-component regulator propeller domain-containing protein [Chitinophaga sp.]
MLRLAIFHVRYLLAPLLLFCASSLLAADPFVKYLGIENGLSNNAVTCVYQDYKGFMWFGTYDGLNKFDGSAFTVFRNRIGDSVSLKGNEIYSIAGDAEHNLWIGGRYGVSIYHSGRHYFSAPYYRPVHAQKTRDISFPVTNIIADRKGMIYAGAEKGGLLVFSPGSDTGRQIPLLENGRYIAPYEVTTLASDRDGSIWLFVQEKGLCRYVPGDNKVTIVNTSLRQGNCIRADDAGHLWIGTDNGLYRYDAGKAGVSGSFIESGCKVFGLCLDARGMLWIASDGKGVYSLEKDASKAKPFISADGEPLINSSAVYAIYEDKQQRKWIGTLRGGVNVIEPKQSSFTTVIYQGEKPNNPNRNFILSFCEAPDGNIWIGTDGGGLRCWDRSRNSYKVYSHDPHNRNSLTGNFVTGIVSDTQQQLWVSTWMGGVSRLHKASGTFEYFPCFNPFTGREEKKVWLLYEDRHRNLWASTSNDGTLYRFNRGTQRFELFDKNIVNIQCLAEDSEGHLWGGNYSSLVRIDTATGKHISYGIGYTVRSIHEDKQGNFWVGTQGGGLLQFNTHTGTYKRYDENNGLGGNTVLRILEDSTGNLWISSFSGLLRFDVKERKFRAFTISDGLQSNQFGFNAALALRSGEFLFGGIKGFNIFYPNEVTAQVNAPEIFLTGIQIDGSPLETNSRFITERTLENVHEITIPYNRSAVVLSFVAPEYGAPDKIRYAYYLDGWDKHWNYSNNVRNANYSRLEEGTYVFRIRATDALGRWGNEIQALRIIVLPPWYRTWWAYALYVSLVFGGIWMYTRYTARQQRLHYEIRLARLAHEKDKELHEKRISFFTNISHEFRTPLTLIINPVKEMLGNRNTAPEQELGTVYRNARRLLSLVDQLLLFRKADSGADILRVARVDIHTLAHEVFLCFSQQARTKNIDYRFETNGERPELFVDREKMEVALFNLLSNAFKFTPDGGSVMLEVRQDDCQVIVQVQDSGCGIKEEDRSHIFEKFRQAAHKAPKKSGFGIGLYLVKHFVENHGGRVGCSNAESGGACFTIVLQKGVAHLPAGYTMQEETSGHVLLEELAGSEQPATAGKQTVVIKGRTAEEVVTSKRSILLIDDDPEIMAYLQQLFHPQYLLYTAADGNEGFRLAQECTPDLIITDISMQGMDGLELCSRIKHSESLGHIPVILLTGTTDTQVKLKGIEGGADDYITKPFDKELLRARVETILRNRSLLQRYFFDNITLKETNVKVPVEYRDFLKKCIEVIEANLDAEDFNIRKFSRLMGMSHSGLYQKVKSISGQSLNAFIRSIRLRRAAVLMLTENLNISQVAFQVGISDVKYFRAQFVKLFGMTPSEYIRRYRFSFNQDCNVIKMAENEEG